MPWMLRDLPQPLWQQFQERAAKEGWPLKALVLQLAEDYVAGRFRPTGKPPMEPKVAVLPMTCTECAKRFEIETPFRAGFGYMAPHLIECPHCGKAHHPMLPAEPIDVRPVVDP